MKIFEKYKEENGLTLIEVLAALVILGIVFIGIMTVFPQMTLFNQKTETKLDTMHLARQEMTTITNIESWSQTIVKNPLLVRNLLDDHYELLQLNYPESGTDEGGKKYKLYKVKKQSQSEYTFDLLIYDIPDLEGPLGGISLYKIILKVKSGTNTSSETYGYLEIPVEESAT